MNLQCCVLVSLYIRWMCSNIFSPEPVFHLPDIVQTVVSSRPTLQTFRQDLEMWKQTRKLCYVKRNTFKSNMMLAYLVMTVLMNSNDVQLNPGPAGAESVYPCGTCDQPVTWDDRAIICDTCDQWYHVNCQNVHTKTYNELVTDSAIAWDCLTCNCPNYSTVCFDQIVSTPNPFSVLSDTSMNSPLRSGNLRPIHSSTPYRGK